MITEEELNQITIIEESREEYGYLTPIEYAVLIELYDKKDAKLL